MQWFNGLVGKGKPQAKNNLCKKKEKLFKVFIPTHMYTLFSVMFCYTHVSYLIQKMFSVLILLCLFIYIYNIYIFSALFHSQKFFFIPYVTLGYKKLELYSVSERT